MKYNSTKETLIKLFCKCGYDTMTACEQTEKAIKSIEAFFKNNPTKKKSIRFIGSYAVTFKPSC